MPAPPSLCEPYEQATVLRELHERFPGMRPRIQMEVDQFGRLVDWTWYARRGSAYLYNKESMAVTVESPQTAAALRQQARWRVLQESDWEMTFLVPDADFAEVAGLVGLHQRV
ncbi:MAG: hypothetical protein COZ06_27555 [Armatimonadetes bacterium CG_4_10_14_3_um_filter_66_18]|nr:hypothetical protein [Armatimonadota bacterium]OIP02895.1 MAG: hypothetical protein AUJ96_15505 [Armatimonadetes bacterium CG2_30_66_41]PIU90193.1 MAG: hypothetical protein COS65_25840 [Armatimonadetes bacterium CG06_land_8_20_14_3_00_66_21]PIX46066.1 MAG: hypothetical protein COZ57_13825 [Armatimonadetes bacterium CG_4_8_14_3_um_filter_66_20]PIY40901.1 MAG: hypothetical protein COZ06_27555 [Armatimonadetes bacterium CG_4_10_14_3_um_filter_66_18]PIZ35191.1 MAG: hypothetical protein COY42_27